MELDYYRELPGDYSPAEAGYLVELGTLKPQAVSGRMSSFRMRAWALVEEAR